MRAAAQHGQLTSHLKLGWLDQLDWVIRRTEVGAVPGDAGLDR